MTSAISRKAGRAQHKRELILAAARKVFEAEGLDGASLRMIAAEAGYTPAALYFHFSSKEEIYAELLQISLGKLCERVNEAAIDPKAPEDQLRAAAMAFYAFYDENPRDLDLGFYLFRGGMRKKGVGRERDEGLNAGLARALRPIETAARTLGASLEEASLLTADTFAHAAGLLLLAHTGRMKMFGAPARKLMKRYIEDLIERLKRGHKSCEPSNGKIALS